MLAMSMEERNSVIPPPTQTRLPIGRQQRNHVSKLTNPHGNNDLNLRLARDQVEHLETAVISLAAGDKQIMFSQFVLFLMRNGKLGLNVEGHGGTKNHWLPWGQSFSA